MFSVEKTTHNKENDKYIKIIQEIGCPCKSKLLQALREALQLNFHYI